MTDLSIVIISYNTKKLLLECIKSIKKYTKGVDYELIVVDNASDDGSVGSIEEFKNIKIIKNKNNVGFAKANNQGLEKSEGRYKLLLNSDTKLTEDSPAEMVAFMDAHPDIGISSCMLINPDGSIQATGGVFPNLFHVTLWAKFLDDLPFVSDIFGSYHPHTPSFLTKSRYYEKEHKQDWVTGAFMLIRRDVVDKIKGLDEGFFMYGEDVEFCLRAKKSGWETWYTPVTKVVHSGAASGNREGTILGEFSGIKKIYQKHYPAWQYPLLVFLLKVAALVRIIVFGILGGQRESLKIYAKAFATS